MRALQLVDDRKLEITDLPEPEAPGPGEVTLRIKAVALNHIDVWGWRGMAFRQAQDAAGDWCGSVGRGRSDRSGRVECPAGPVGVDLWRAHLRPLPPVPRRP
jgi:threonine dehydrogenase-like Zn-dependent dehydrogenase